VSGCCGQGPVIVSGAAATPRVDVETVLLCDVLADGTVAGVALVEPVYDTSSGARVGTRTVDPVTGATYTPQGTLGPCSPDGCNATTSVLVLCDVAADGTVTQFVRAATYDCQGALLATVDRTLAGAAYTVTGTVEVCPTSPDCESPTTPTATVGLCLPDGTPIAVTVVRDCDGVVTSEGWINLQTGAYSSGAPPVGTIACGSSQSIQVSGTFCDVDAAGDILGLVLIEYSYAADGTIDSVRLVDATTGATYTPTGTVTTCPAGIEQPEQDVVQLCDVAADGTTTPFIRDYRRDELGAIVGHSDYLLDGTAYVPAGTVGACHADCRNSSTVLVCDVPADASSEITPTITDSNAAAVGQTQFPNLPGSYAALWSGGSLNFPAGAGPGQEHLIAVGQLAADLAGCEGTSGSVTISVRVTQNGPGTGQLWDGALRLFRGTTLLADAPVAFYAPPGHVQTLTVTAPVTAADLTAGDIRVGLALETFHGTPKSWTADQFTATVELEGCEVTIPTQFLRTLVTDCVSGDVLSTTDTTLDGDPYTVTGAVAQCTPSEPAECRDCEGSVLCDTVDGEDPVPFLRTVCRDCGGAVVSVLDTELDGTTAYAVQGMVGSCSSQCEDCETLVLCDVPTSAPVTITGTAASGTLSNGVGWTSTGATNTTAMAPNLSNADGSWWGLHSFPHAITAPTRWTFSRPVIVEFSVYVRYHAANPAISHAQLPPGLEVVHLPDGYAYNETTGVLTRTSDDAPADPCSYVTDPQIATSARFRTAAAVTSFTTAPAPGSRVAVCSQFFTYWAGAVSVVPGGPFLRHICRSCDGTATVTDTLLDGITPYTVAGTAGVCEPPAPPEPESCCQPVQVCIQQDPTQEVEFISNEGHLNDSSVDPVWKWTPDLSVADPPWYDMYEFQYSAAWSVTDTDTARPAWWVSPHPTGGIQQSSPPLPNEGPTLTAQHWYPRAFFDLPDNADPATIQVQATVFNADQIGRAFRLNDGAWQALPATATHNGTPYTFGPATIPGAQAGRNFLYLDVEETVGGGAGLMVHLKVTYEVIPETRSWTRMVCCDDSVYYLDEDGQRQDAVPDGWHLAPCTGEAGSSTTGCANQVVERCGCDDTDGDGIGDVTYTELWAVDPCGGQAPTLLGTYLGGDLAQPYTPVAPVECTAAETLPGPLSTGVRAVTGTAAQDIAAAFPGLQSVSLTVLAGTVNATMSDGAAVPIPAGVTMTWSVAQDRDTALTAASFTGASAAANYLLNWTYR
jgi:hypothetical protein